MLIIIFGEANENHYDFAKRISVVWVIWWGTKMDQSKQTNWQTDEKAAI